MSMYESNLLGDLIIHLMNIKKLEFNKKRSVKGLRKTNTKKIQLSRAKFAQK